MTVVNGHSNLRSEAAPKMVNMEEAVKKGRVVAVDLSSWAVAACKGIDSARQQNRVPPVPEPRRGRRA